MSSLIIQEQKKRIWNNNGRMTTQAIVLRHYFTAKVSRNPMNVCNNFRQTIFGCNLKGIGFQNQQSLPMLLNSGNYNLRLFYIPYDGRECNRPTCEDNFQITMKQLQTDDLLK